MYEEIITDLRRALDSGAYVDVSLANGESFQFRHVLELDEQSGWVGIHDPQNLGDATTSRKIRLDQIVGVTVMDD